MMFPTPRFLLAAGLLSLLAACTQPSPEELLGTAEAELNAGKFRSATVQLKAFLQQDPNSLRARWLLGEVYLKTGNGESAEKEFERLLKLGGSQQSVLPQLAQALLMQGKTDDVLALDKQNVLSGSAKAEVLAAQGLAYRTKGDEQRADQLTQQALDMAPNSLPVVTARIKWLIANDHLDDAAEMLAVVDQYWPGDFVGNVLRGDIASRREQFDEADEAYSEALKQQPFRLFVRVKRANLRLVKNDLDGALEDAEYLARQAPKMQRAHYIMGLVHFTKKEFAAAAENLDTAVQLDRSHVPSLVTMGWSQLALGNLNQAIQPAEQALGAAPNVIPVRLLAAAVYLKEGKPGRAEELLRPVVAAAPEDLYARGMLAESLRKQGKAVEASAVLEEVAEIEVKSTEEQTRLATLLLTAGLADKALPVLDRGAAHASPAKNAELLRITALSQSGKTDEAIDAIKALHLQSPDDLDVLRLMGTLQRDTGDLAAANATFRTMLRIEPGNPEASVMLADQLVNDGDLAGGRELLERAADRNPGDAGLITALAEVIRRQGRPEEYKAYLLKAIENDPTRGGARAMLARQYLEEDDPKAALAILPQGDDVASAAVQLERAQAYLIVGDTDRALKDLTSLAERYAESARVHYLLARVYASQGDEARMEKALNKAYQLQPDNRAVVNARARALAVAGKFDAANELMAGTKSTTDPATLETRLFIAREASDRVKALEAAEDLYALRVSQNSVVQLVAEYLSNRRTDDAVALMAAWLADHPNDGEIVLAMAEVLEQVGKRSQAVKLLQDYVAANTGDVAALNNLAWYLRESDSRAAMEYAKRAHELAPRNVRVMDTYATALAAAGRFDDALTTLDEAVALSQGSAYFRLQRADILLQSGAVDRASRELRDVEKAGVPEVWQAKLSALRTRVAAAR